MLAASSTASAKLPLPSARHTRCPMTRCDAAPCPVAGTKLEHFLSCGALSPDGCVPCRLITVCNACGQFDKGSKNACEYDTSEKRRVPAWTDRILFRGSHAPAEVPHHICLLRGLLCMASVQVLVAMHCLVTACGQHVQLLPARWLIHSAN